MVAGRTSGWTTAGRSMLLPLLGHRTMAASFSAGTALCRSVFSIASDAFFSQLGPAFQSEGGLGRHCEKLAEVQVLKVDGGIRYIFCVKSTEVCHRASGSAPGTCVRQSESGIPSYQHPIPWFLYLNYTAL